MDLVPLDGMKLLPDPDMTITVNVTMNNLNNGINYAFFNELTWVAPKVPVLYTVMSSPDGMETDATIYGDNTHTYVLKHNDVIDIVLNNEDAGTHPFHMHGRVFQVPYRSEAYEDDDMTPFDPEDEDIKFAEVPMRRDTVYVKPNGNMVMRFRADNPGVWFFHCHIEWHMEQGLAFTLVEAPEELKKQYVPPTTSTPARSPRCPPSETLLATTPTSSTCLARTCRRRICPPASLPEVLLLLSSPVSLPSSVWELWPGTEPLTSRTRRFE